MIIVSQFTSFGLRLSNSLGEPIKHIDGDAGVIDDQQMDKIMHSSYGIFSGAKERQVIASSTGTVVDVAECCILHDALIAEANSGGHLLDARYEVLGLNTLLSKKPGDKANETDRAITVRMDFITRILTSKK